MDEIRTAPPSEALQQTFGGRDCPYLRDCEALVTRDFFTRVCGTTTYINCHHYAKMVGELRTPMAWLQKLAIEQDRVVEPEVEIQ